MAQFDVYINPNKHSASTYPYILDIQHGLIDSLATRIVLPLVFRSLFRDQVLKGLTPEVLIDDQRLLILTPQVTSVAAKTLKKPIGSLQHMRAEIIAALDLAITGI